MKKERELSAGILFFNEDHRLFMARMTGLKTKHGSRWDIPKGHVEPGEEPIDAAMRECYEETGFTAYTKDRLVDLGAHDYADNKDIHLFFYGATVRNEDFKDCVCTAFHQNDDGTMIPEMDRFAFIKKEMWQYTMGPSLYKVLTKLFG